MNFKFYLLSLVSSGMALYLLIHFIMIWLYGKVQIYEPNTLILSLEITMTVFIISFSAFCVFSGFKNIKRNNLS